MIISELEFLKLKEKEDAEKENTYALIQNNKELYQKHQDGALRAFTENMGILAKELEFAKLWGLSPILYTQYKDIFYVYREKFDAWEVTDNPNRNGYIIQCCATKYRLDQCIENFRLFLEEEKERNINVHI